MDGLWLVMLLLPIRVSGRSPFIVEGDRAGFELIIWFLDDGSLGPRFQGHIIGADVGARK